MAQSAPDKEIFTKSITGSAEQVQKVLDQGANPNAKNKNGLTPLIYAAWFNAHAIGPLLKAGAKPNDHNTNGLTPLMVAAASNPYTEARTAAFDVLFSRKSKKC